MEERGGKLRKWKHNGNRRLYTYRAESDIILDSTRGLSKYETIYLVDSVKETSEDH